MKQIRSWYSRRSAWSRRLLLLVVGVIVAGLVLGFTPTGWYITAPGAAIDTSRLVSVPGGQSHRNQLYMLVVTTQPANLFWYLYAKLDPRSELETPSQFLGDITDYDKYMELTRQMMADSSQTAKAIALEQLGRGSGVSTAGVVVTDLVTGSPAQGFLLKGDTIVGLAGTPVPSTPKLRAVLGETKPGARIDVRFKRKGEELTLAVPTYENPDRKGAAALGIFAKDYLVFDVPIPVEIKPGLITGPSAGLMFTLQIIDQLTPGGIAGNMVVAGTGTINPDGTVGPIGGVQQKVYAAEAAGARVFFSPMANYADASKVATRIEVVPVEHVRDALSWLKAQRGQK